MEVPPIPEITKENLPQIRQVLMDYATRNREAFELETEMLRAIMAVVDKLDEVLEY